MRHCGFSIFRATPHARSVSHPSHLYTMEEVVDSLLEQLLFLDGAEDDAKLEALTAKGKKLMI